ncbi:GNAT family N-acetyltransferase [Chloroflexota bacterium]
MLKFREYKLEDAKDHYEAVRASLDTISKWFSWAKPDYCLCESIQFMKDQVDQKLKGKHAYAIYDTDNEKRFLGNCSFNLGCENGEITATMSYWRRQDINKCGIMYPALKDVIKIAFEDFNANRIRIDIAHCNIASIKTTLKIMKNMKKTERDIPIEGGDGKIHKGTSYLLSREDYFKSA